MNIVQQKIQEEKYLNN